MVEACHARPCGAQVNDELHSKHVPKELRSIRAATTGSAFGEICQGFLKFTDYLQVLIAVSHYLNIHQAVQFPSSHLEIQ